MADQQFDQEETVFRKAAGFETLADQHIPLPAEKHARILARAMKQAAAQERAVPTAPAAPVKRRSIWGRMAVGIAAAAAVSAVTLVTPYYQSYRVVHAMELAVSQIKTYHAIVEYRWVFPPIADKNIPERTEVDTEEVWYSGNQYRHVNRLGEILIGDGVREWYVRPEDKAASHGFAFSSDLHEFHPANLIKDHSVSEYRVEGDELIAGRLTTRLARTTEVGTESKLWVDKETNLPLQYQNTTLSGSVYTRTYKLFELNEPIEPSMFTFTPPDDYKVWEAKGTIVKTAAEAAAIAGFEPIMPKDPPRRIVAGEGSITLDYGYADITFTKATPDEKLVYYSRQDFGWADGGPVTVGGTMEWNQGDLHVFIYGDERKVDLARQIAPDMVLPKEERQPIAPPEVEAALDYPAVLAAQKAYLLDPTKDDGRKEPEAVAAEYLKEVAGLENPELTVALDGGQHIIYAVANSPITRVHVRRIVRQDELGLWWVFGHDTSEGAFYLQAP